MISSITTPQVTELLDSPYEDAARNDPLVHQAARESALSFEWEPDFYHAMRNADMPVGRGLGNLLYALARSRKATTLVEFRHIFWHLNRLLGVRSP
jgi:hypothetical protein